MDRDDAIAMIEERHAVLEAQDYYACLGVPRDAPVADIKTAYRALVRQFHADRFRGLELGDVEAKLNAVFTRITSAHNTLTHPEKRQQYDVDLGGEVAVTAADMEDIFAADSAFRTGKAMLERGQFQGALEKFQFAARVNPDDPDTKVHLAFAEFMSAPLDAKGSRGQEAQRALQALEKFIETNKQHPQALLFLAKTQKLSGLEDRAIANLKRVLDINAKHPEALRELRLIQMRKQAPETGFMAKLKGLFAKK